MPWTVAWSKTQEAKAHEANGNAHVFEAEDRDAALDFAKAQIDTGRIVWCVRNEQGAVVLDRQALWDHLHPPGKPRGSDLADDWYLSAKDEPSAGTPPPAEQKPFPFEHVMRFFRKG